MKKPGTINGLNQTGRSNLQNSINRLISGKHLLIILFNTVIITGLMLIPACESNKPSDSDKDTQQIIPSDTLEKTVQWYRGNTHTHARFSDDNDINDVPMIAGWYKEAGYNFLVLSEHNDHVAIKKVFSHDEAAVPPDFIMLNGLELSNNRHHTALGIDSYIGDETSLQDGVNKIIAAGGVVHSTD